MPQNYCRILRHLLTYCIDISKILIEYTSKQIKNIPLFQKVENIHLASESLKYIQYFRNIEPLSQEVLRYSYKTFLELEDAFPAIHKSIDYLNKVLPKATANSRNVYTLI